jgi:hypothetical protein
MEPRDAESSSPVAMHAVTIRPYDFASLAGYIFISLNPYKSVGARVITDAGTEWIAATHTWCWDNLLFIIIIGKFTISFMQGIYTYIPETNHVPKEYNVAAFCRCCLWRPYH